MTYEQIIRNPLKVIWHDVPALVVKGYDNRFYILHNNRADSGDNAGPIKEQLGFEYSWALGHFDNSREYNHEYHGTTPCSSISEPDLSFKKLKKFSI